LTLFARLIEVEEHPAPLHVLPHLQVVFVTFNENSLGKWCVTDPLFFWDMVVGGVWVRFK
jgi:hypothetical protein